MRGVKGFMLGALALVAFAPAARATTVTGFTDVPSSFWANTQIVWSVNQGWMLGRAANTFAPGLPATRLAAARVLVKANEKVHGQPASIEPLTQAIEAGWLGAGGSPGDPITQITFDRAVVRMLGVRPEVVQLNRLQTADGWRPKLPIGFGVEQVVRQAGVRVNVPFGADAWETWPLSTMRRANLASEAYQLGHLSSWWKSAVDAQTQVATALPAYPPVKQQMLAFALSYAGAPYIWGGTSDQPQSLFGLPAAGGFDCSGFVWWVMKLHSYTANGLTWSGASTIQWRTTFDMAAHIPAAKRLPYAALRPGDVLFWSSAPNGALTASSTVYHTGIYLGNGWTINSHGGGDGVTLDYMGPGAGWFHDAFAFGWRVMPLGK
ncbi:MAG: C40 family peptidase [Gaiellales bacterium]